MRCNIWRCSDPQLMGTLIPGAAMWISRSSFASPPDSATATHYFELKQDLENVFGRPIDLVELNAMPDSRLKREIERTQVLIYTEL
jgi:hypothetical protein